MGPNQEGRLRDGTTEAEVGVFVKRLHDKVISKTSASQFDMRYTIKGGREKKGPLQDEEYYRDSIYRTPGTVMNILSEFHFSLTPAPTLCI